jgi:hypothetical protein
MFMLPPTPVRLVLGLLRTRGIAIGEKRLRDALNSGVIPGTYDQGRWTMTAGDVDAAERYFREVDTSGGQKAGAAAVEEAKRRSRQGRGPC